MAPTNVVQLTENVSTVGSLATWDEFVVLVPLLVTVDVNVVDPFVLILPWFGAIIIRIFHHLP